MESDYDRNISCFWKKSEFWISISATIIALISLIFAVTESKRSREYDRLSTIPRIGITFWYRQDKAGFDLGNMGLGPGQLKWFQVFVDGEPHPNWRSVLEGLGFDPAPEYSFIVPGFGLWWKNGVEYNRTVFSIQGLENRVRMKELSNRIDITGCYCSIYDQCWIFKRSLLEPQEVSSCDPQPEIKFSAPPPRI